MHRYEYTLDLLRQVIDKAPKFFPAERKKEMLAEFKSFREGADTPVSKIEDAIISFGREIWPYRKSFWHVHDEAKIEEEQYIREKLKDALGEKYETFLRKGGRIEDIRKEAQLDELETFFTPEELAELVEAKISAHDKVVKEVESLCVGEKSGVCTDAIGLYKEEQKKIDELVAQLKALAGQSGKWEAEILDKVRIFEAGWSGLEREVRSEDVAGEIDYYLGVIMALEP